MGLVQLRRVIKFQEDLPGKGGEATSKAPVNTNVHSLHSLYSTETRPNTNTDIRYENIVMNSYRRAAAHVRTLSMSSARLYNQRVGPPNEEEKILKGFTASQLTNHSSNAMGSNCHFIESSGVMEIVAAFSYGIYNQPPDTEITGVKRIISPL